MLTVPPELHLKILRILTLPSIHEHSFYSGKLVKPSVNLEALYQLALVSRNWAQYVDQIFRFHMPLWVQTGSAGRALQERLLVQREQPYQPSGIIFERLPQHTFPTAKVVAQILLTCNQLKYLALSRIKGLDLGVQLSHPSLQSKSLARPVTVAIS